MSKAQRRPFGRLRAGRTLTGLAFCSPVILGLLLFMAYPIVASLVYSFCRYSVLRPPTYLGAANYQHLVHDELFWKSLANTGYYAIIAVPLGIVVALALAMLLNTRIRGLPAYRTFFYVPSIVPLVASSVLWVWLFNPQSGAINAVLRPILALIAKQPPGWLSDPHWSKAVLILWSVWGIGGAMVIYLAGLQDVPQELYEAAEVDGAGPWHRLWNITLPFISPHLLFTFIMGLIGAFQFFTPAFVMTGSGGSPPGGPVDSTLFYALYLFQVAFSDFKMGYACAMAWILFLLILGATVLIFRSSARHVYYAGGERQ